MKLIYLVRNLSLADDGPLLPAIWSIRAAGLGPVYAVGPMRQKPETNRQHDVLQEEPSLMVGLVNWCSATRLY